MIVQYAENGNSDIWSDWLLRIRHAEDDDLEAHVRSLVDQYAERVLDGAMLFPGATIVDVGTGEGVVAFRAIERIGKSLQVIMTDISTPMLDHARRVTSKLGLKDQCNFIACSADNLSMIPDSSVDAVVTRSVLAYVSDKCKALREFHRILKPGGRISIAEPIMQDEALYARALKIRVDSHAGHETDKFMTLLHRWKSAQFPDTEDKCASNPLVNYNERNLLRFVLDSGFKEAHLELHIDVRPSVVKSWDVFLGCSPHPWAPPLKSILTEEFTAEERQLFERVVRPGVEAGDGVNTERIAFLTAVKPLQ